MLTPLQVAFFTEDSSSFSIASDKNNINANTESSSRNIVQSGEEKSTFDSSDSSSQLKRSSLPMVDSLLEVAKHTNDNKDAKPTQQHATQTHQEDSTTTAENRGMYQCSFLSILIHRPIKFRICSVSVP